MWFVAYGKEVRKVIKAGRFIIHHPHEGKVWITDSLTGEGGAFEVVELEMMLDTFWRENF